MRKSTNIPTVAIVYDKVSVGFGGAERVLQALHLAYPDAPLYTSVATTEASAWSNSIQIKTSFLQKLHWIPQSYRVLVPFFPLAFESFSFDAFDIIISVTSGEAKGILTKPNQLHICYLLTPPRYLYSHATAYEKHNWASSRLIRPMYRMATSYLRWWDFAAAQRPDYLIPISKLTADRAQRYYARKCQEVVYPPAPFSPQVTPFNLPTTYVLSVARFVPYKRVDISIQACMQLDRVLIVAGNGMEANSLHQLAAEMGAVRNAKETIEQFSKRALNYKKKILFVGSVSDSDLQRLYSGADALLMPGIEDFGITALEAAQQGTPTILPIQSGVAELLTPPKHAIQLLDLTVDAMIESIKTLDSTSIKPDSLRNIAKVHTFSHFQKSIKKQIETLWQHHNNAKETYVTT